MNDPIKPRIDFDASLSAEPTPSLQPGMAFDAHQAEAFTPLAPSETEAEQEEGQLEGMVSMALRPRRSLWRRIAAGGVVLFGLSVLAQGRPGCIRPGSARTGLRWAAVWPEA